MGKAVKNKMHQPDIEPCITCKMSGIEHSPSVAYELNGKVVPILIKRKKDNLKYCFPCLMAKIGRCLGCLELVGVDNLQADTRCKTRPCSVCIDCLIKPYGSHTEECVLNGCLSQEEADAEAAEVAAESAELGITDDGGDFIQEEEFNQLLAELIKESDDGSFQG